MNDRSTYCRSDLDMGQMERCAKDVEWAVVELGVCGLRLLHRQLPMNDYESTSMWCSTLSIGDKSGGEQLIGWQQIRDLPTYLHLAHQV